MRDAPLPHGTLVQSEDLERFDDLVRINQRICEWRLSSRMTSGRDAMFHSENSTEAFTPKCRRRNRDERSIRR